MCLTYVQGLCWVLKYYYEGVPSWNWYYPFHYAPFASDLVNIDSYEEQGVKVFDKSKPFRPVEQLLAVLPANSVKALPEPCHWLMTDSSSPILDLYDSDIPIDPNGKVFPWLWILLLPFVDENRITAAYELCKPSLTLEERRRNAYGCSVVFTHADHPLAKLCLSEGIIYAPGPEKDVEVIDALQSEKAMLCVNDGVGEGVGSTILLDSSIGENTSNGTSNGNGNGNGTYVTYVLDSPSGNGMAGTMSQPPPNWFAQSQVAIPVPKKNPRTFGFRPIECNRAVCFTYQLPACGMAVNRPHQSDILPGAILPPCVLDAFDLAPKRPPRYAPLYISLYIPYTHPIHTRIHTLHTPIHTLQHTLYTPLYIPHTPYTHPYNTPL